jgi:hypothetical protein
MLRQITLISFIVSLAAATVVAQSTTPTEPLFPRGILPGSLQVGSDFDDVSINSGNLFYHVPLYRFPGPNSSDREALGRRLKRRHGIAKIFGWAVGGGLPIEFWGEIVDCFVNWHLPRDLWFLHKR